MFSSVVFVDLFDEIFLHDHEFMLLFIVQITEGIDSVHGLEEWGLFSLPILLLFNEFLLSLFQLVLLDDYWFIIFAARLELFDLIIELLDYV